MAKDTQQDAGRGKSISECLATLRKGSLEDLYKMLPSIGVLRHESFLAPLAKLLKDSDRNKQEFAAHALGALGDPKALRPLHDLLLSAKTHKGKNSELLQTAIIDAMGEIGSTEGVGLLKEILNSRLPSEGFSKRRKELIIESLGTIAQQGDEAALQALVDLLDDQDPEIRLTIIPEIYVAFWHRPNEIPDEVFNRLVRFTKDANPSIRYTAFLELKTLADLGCHKARALRIPDKIMDSP